MTTETMSVYKALCELKLLADRINKSISALDPCVAMSKSPQKINGVSRADFERNAISSIDSCEDLIKRRNAIKRAVVLSNATTKITISGEEMTVAEAIEMKTNGTLFKQAMLHMLQKKYAEAKADATRANLTLDERAEKFLASMYSQKEIKVGGEEIESLRKNYIDKNTVEIVDPANAAKKIQDMEASIAAFLSEFDSALSVSNATTQITVTY